MSRTTTLARGLGWGCMLAAGTLLGCQTPTDPASPLVGDRATTLTDGSRRPNQGLSRAQTQVMDFADDFTLRLADMTDRIEARTPSMDARIAIHRLRYTMAHGLTVIAASANPKVALIDAVVVMTIQRRLVEERLVPEYFEDTPWITTVFRNAEEQVKAYAADTFTPEQMGEIETLCNSWVEGNEYRHYAAYVRLADFAGTRQEVAASNGSRSLSLLGFLTLDPLAGLDPATKEIEQTRLFAERAMFYLQRMPQLISWQAELLYIDTASEPEVVQALLDVSSLSASVERATRDITTLREDLPVLIAAEREAAINQASLRFFEGLAVERVEMFNDLDARAAELDSTLASLTRALEAGDALAGKSTALVKSVESLTDSIRAMQGEPAPEPAGDPADPTTIRDYEQAIASATALVDKIDELVHSVTELAESESWEMRRQTVDDTMGDAQQRLEAVLDRTYRRAFILVTVLLAGFLMIGLVLKVVPGRKRV